MSQTVECDQGHKSEDPIFPVAILGGQAKAPNNLRYSVETAEPNCEGGTY